MVAINHVITAYFLAVVFHLAAVLHLLCLRRAGVSYAVAGDGTHYRTCGSCGIAPATATDLAAQQATGYASDYRSRG